MFLKISQKNAVTAEYWSIRDMVSITTISDGEFDTSEVVAHVRLNNKTLTVYKHQNAWLVNDDGVTLEVINRDYMWSTK